MHTDFLHWCTENVSFCAGKLAREEQIQPFGILRFGRQRILPFQLSSRRVIFLSLTTSYTKSHIMYLFCLFSNCSIFFGSAYRHIAFLAQKHCFQA